MLSKLRYFIISPGRTGSSLLAACLVKTGADFGMPAATEWDPHDGDFERPDFAKAAFLYGRAHTLAPAQPAGPVKLALWRAYRKRAERRLRRALAAAAFFKAVDADLVLQPAVKLGYAPRVILSVRPFAEQAASQYVRSKHWTANFLLAHYLRTLRNGLVAVRVFGGCVVSHRALMAPEESAWARALAGATGLDAAAILAARAELARPAEAMPELPCLSPEADRLYAEAEALEGRMLEPLRPALRAITRRAGAQTGARR